MEHNIIVSKMWRHGKIVGVMTLVVTLRMCCFDDNRGGVIFIWRFQTISVAVHWATSGYYIGRGRCHVDGECLSRGIGRDACMCVKNHKLIFR